MPEIRIKRIYDPLSREDGCRVLVDRVWPRGVKKEDARIDRWAKEVAPSTALRKWFDHDPAKWEEFKTRYREELKGREAALRDIVDGCPGSRLTLLFSARDTEHNQAVVLRDVLARL